MDIKSRNHTLNKEIHMSESAASSIPRDPAGRFVPGQSGNPAGKVPGTRNRASLLRELMEEGEDRAIVRLVLDKAKGGDAVAARFVVAHLCPRPRPRARSVEIALADGLPAHNVVAAHDAVLRALFAGTIAPDEAEAVTRVIDARARALAAWRQEAMATSGWPAFPALPARAGVAEEAAAEAAAAEEAEDADPAAGPATGAASAAQHEGSVAEPSSTCISPANAGQGTQDSDLPSRPAAPGGRLHSACIRQGEQVMTRDRCDAAPALLAALAGRAPPAASTAFAGGEDSA